MKIRRFEHKLSEAEFFLEHLKKEYQMGGRLRGYLTNEEETHPDPVATPFQFYLSAFLSAARSVTWVIQNEAKTIYDSWFPQWSQKLCQEDRDLLKFMNDQRVSEVHNLGLEFQIEQRVEVTEPVFFWLDIIPPYIGASEWCVKAPGGEPVEVLKLCERYLSLLKRLSDEFPS